MYTISYHLLRIVPTPQIIPHLKLINLRNRPSILLIQIRPTPLPKTRPSRTHPSMLPITPPPHKPQIGPTPLIRPHTTTNAMHIVAPALVARRDPATADGSSSDPSPSVGVVVVNGVGRCWATPSVAAGEDILDDLICVGHACLTG